MIELFYLTVAAEKYLPVVLGIAIEEFEGGFHALMK
jgi:hypothetical protein